jgi:hypothetical protein
MIVENDLDGKHASTSYIEAERLTGFGSIRKGLGRHRGTRNCRGIGIGGWGFEGHWCRPVTRAASYTEGKKREQKDPHR